MTNYFYIQLTQMIQPFFEFYLVRMNTGAGTGTFEEVHVANCSYKLVDLTPDTMKKLGNLF